MKTAICDRMSFHCLCLAVLLLPTATAAAADQVSEPLYLVPGCELVFADVPTGRRIIAEKDMFTESVGPCLKAVTLKTNEPVTTDTYLSYLQDQVRAWTESEKQVIRQAAEALSSKLQPFHLRLPERIMLIKTTGRDMLGCAYCRYCAIVFPETIFSFIGDRMEYLLAHELFHVYSRFNLPLRTKLYGLLDFKPCNEIELPESIASRKMTNPDAPLNNYYVSISTPHGPQDVLPILLAYHAGYDPNTPELFGFMAYARTQLLVLEKANDRWQPRLENGEPVVLEMADTPGFFQKVGLNTHYVLGVEEVLAENFTLLILDQQPVASPEILEKLMLFLTAHQAPAPILSK